MTILMIALFAQETHTVIMLSLNVELKVNHVLCVGVLLIAIKNCWGVLLRNSYDYVNCFNI